MKALRFLILMAVLVVTVPAAAQDIPCPQPPCTSDAPCPLIACNPPTQPGVFTNPEWLKIDYHRVTVAIENQIATTNSGYGIRQ